MAQCEGEEMSEWISVKDRLPEPCCGKRFLAYGRPQCGSHPEDFVIEFCVYEKTANGHCYFSFGEYDCSIDVTHWMPLPEPPKGPYE